MRRRFERVKLSPLAVWLLLSIGLCACGSAADLPPAPIGGKGDVPEWAPELEMDVYLKRVAVSGARSYDAFSEPDLYVTVSIGALNFESTPVEDVGPSEVITIGSNGEEVRHQYRQLDFCADGCGKIGSTTLARLNANPVMYRVFDHDGLLPPQDVAACRVSTVDVPYLWKRISGPGLLRLQTGAQFVFLPLTTAGSAINSKGAALIGDRKLYESGGGHTCSSHLGMSATDSQDRLLEILVVPKGDDPQLYLGDGT